MMSRLLSPSLRWLHSYFLLCGMTLLGILFLPSAFSEAPVKQTPFLMAWSFEYFFPTLRLEMEHWEWTSMTEVTLQGITLYERTSDEKLAEVKQMDIRFHPHEVLGRRIEEIRITEPKIFISSAFISAMASMSSTMEKTSEAAKSSVDEWEIGRLQCAFGEIFLDKLSGIPVKSSARFSFDLQECGTTEALLTKAHSISVWDLDVAESQENAPAFLTLNTLQLDFTMEHLLQDRCLDNLKIAGGKLNIGKAITEIFKASPASSAEKKPSPTSAFQLKNLQIADIKTTLMSDIPGVGAGFEYTLHTSLNNIPLGELPEVVGKEVQQLELANIEIVSPTDSSVRVITLHSIFVYFTLDGILSSRLQQVVLLSPTLYISQDLFLYMATMQGEEKKPFSPSDEKSTPWVIENLRIEYGRLVLGGERIGQVGLPLSFQTTATNVSFADLASLRLETTLDIDPQTFTFPALQLGLEQLRGNLRFAYPPDKAQDNLVNELHLDGMLWRQFQAKQLWLAATFDKTGINASLGGEAYSGYVTAGLSFTFGSDSRWIGWVTGTGIDLKQLTDVLAPQNFQLTGPADFRIEVDAHRSIFDRVKGRLHAKTPGTLRIAKLDDILANLPNSWSSLKKSGSKVALESLRDFRYEKADAEFWIVENQGKLTLRLPGKEGSRNLDLYLFADETPDGRWKNNKKTPISSP